MSDGQQQPDLLENLKHLLDEIGPEEAVTVKEESLAVQESNRFGLSADEENAKIEIQRKSLEVKSMSQDIDERKKYATMIFYLVCFWLLLVLLIVVYSGWDAYRVHVADSVLIALITGVSVNVIALFAIVAKYLFPKR
ncbi:MAG: hypothetical protein K8T91_01450 [Planctomycetes bacterium]|nr:hypothetical protein [Planctomycetota bacterium]